MNRSAFTVLAGVAFAANLGAVALAAPSPTAAPVAAALQADIQKYLSTYKTAEHISAASLSVSLASRDIIDVAAGTTAYGGGAAVTPGNLFQVGSNTKAFTSTLIAKLQTAKKLSTDDTLGHWLPQYAPWKAITIRQLLNMTSGIETYDNTQTWQKSFSADPYHFYTTQQLVGYVSGTTKLLPGWNYTNTAYILTSMIAEKASSGTSYTDLVRRLVIAPTKIRDLYYYPGIYPRTLRLRTVQGYFYNPAPYNKGLMPVLGKSVRDYSVSWMQAAGAIVATPHAVALWARDLYQGPILTSAERAGIETLVSSKTGLPLKETTPQEPRAFGLGVSETYKPGLGRIWFYEGESLGYRMLHVYFPQQDVVIAFGLNSQASPKSDHIGDIVGAVVQSLKAHKLF